MWDVRGGPHTPLPTTHAVMSLRQEAVERPGPRDVPQPRQRLLLDLPHALAGDAELRADLLERHRVLSFQPEVQTQDLGLAILERAEHLLDGFGEGVLEDLVVGARVRDRKSVV